MTQLQLFRYVVIDRNHRVIAKGEQALPPGERKTFERTLLRNHARQGARDVVVH